MISHTGSKIPIYELRRPDNDDDESPCSSVTELFSLTIVCTIDSLSAAAHPATPNECALRLPQVCKMTALRRSMIYRMQAEKRFPQRIKLSERAVGWLEREVQEWLAQRIKNSR